MALLPPLSFHSPYVLKYVLTNILQPLERQSHALGLAMGPQWPSRTQSYPRTVEKACGGAQLRQRSKEVSHSHLAVTIECLPN